MPPKASPFVNSLFTMVSDAENRNEIRWTTDGKGIFIENEERLQLLLPAFFRFDVVSTFTKLLIASGFRKIGDGAYRIYAHPKFQRDREDLLPLVNLAHSKGEISVYDEHATPSVSIKKIDSKSSGKSKLTNSSVVDLENVEGDISLDSDSNHIGDDSISHVHRISKGREDNPGEEEDEDDEVQVIDPAEYQRQKQRKTTASGITPSFSSLSALPPSSPITSSRSNTATLSSSPSSPSTASRTLADTSLPRSPITPEVARAILAGQLSKPTTRLPTADPLRGLPPSTLQRLNSSQPITTMSSSAKYTAPTSSPGGLLPCTITPIPFPTTTSTSTPITTAAAVRGKVKAEPMIKSDPFADEMTRTRSLLPPTTAHALSYQTSSVPLSRSESAPQRGVVKHETVNNHHDEDDEDEDEEGAKGKRKRKRKEKVVVEKRQGRYRAICPAAIITKMDRALNQTMYLVERKPRKDGELKLECAILGSVGNIYNVVIDHKPSCTCPDFNKPSGSKPCKHILFVMVRVLKQSRLSQHIFQTGLLTSELEEIFAAAPNPPADVMASSAVRRTYSELVGHETPAAEITQKPIDDNDCPICYEPLKRGILLWCRTCGNSVHKNCFDMWSQTKRQQQNDVTCVYCRSLWPVSGGAPGARVNTAGYTGVTTTREGYLNLKKLQPDQRAQTADDVYGDPRFYSAYIQYGGRGHHRYR